MFQKLFAAIVPTRRQLLCMHATKGVFNIAPFVSFVPFVVEINQATNHSKPGGTRVCQSVTCW